MSQIIEYEAYRNRTYIFRSRSAAGDLLADMLSSDPVVGSDALLLAIPMGGVPVALPIHRRLGCPMDLIITRKIQIPGNTEAGFGAMTSEEDIFLNKALMSRLNLTDRQIESQLAEVRNQLSDRNRRLRMDRPFPDLKGKTVILVDDGLASGYTMKAAIHMTKKRKASQIIVAVPTAPRRTIDALSGSVHTIVCANIREGLSFAAADAYENWHDLTEAEVMALL